MSAFVRSRKFGGKVPKDLKERVDEMFAATRAVSFQVSRALSFERWTPIQGALLLSGIRPSPRWVDTAVLDGPERSGPISHCEIFEKRLSSMQGRERGLDDEPVSRDSLRFRNARGILVFWDEACEHQANYFLHVEPRAFVQWTVKEHRKGNFFIPAPNWLELFGEKCGLSTLNTIIPQEIFELFSPNSQTNRDLIPKHRLGNYILKAWTDAKADGAAENDPDEVLFRLSDLIESRKIPNLQLIKYDPKLGIEYRDIHTQARYTLRRDSLARQLRRMVKRQSEPETFRDIRSAPIPMTNGFPYIRRVDVRTDLVNELTRNVQLIKLARDLVAEAAAHVRIAAGLEIAGKGWPKNYAVVVGNMARLSKLLISIDVLASCGLTEMLALIYQTTLGTVVDIKYLIVNFNKNSPAPPNFEIGTKIRT